MVANANHGRRGAIAVEMAVVTPFLLMMLMGIMEMGILFGAWQDLTLAAREGCREAIRQGVETSDVEDIVDLQMTAAGFGDADFETTVTHNPPGTDAETVEVRVEIPWSDVWFMPLRFWPGAGDATLTAFVRMRQEVF